MSYRISQDEQLADAVRRIADEQLGKAMDAMTNLGDSTAELNFTVHSVRKRCKKLRGLLRLVRDALGEVYQYENQSIRDAARMLAAFRDGQVILETHDSIVDCFGGAMDAAQTGSVRALLTSQLAKPADAVTSVSSRQTIDEARLSLRSVRSRLDSWLESGVSDGVLRQGIRRTYKRARKGLSHARYSGSANDFHEFRKRLKYHGYHLRLIEACAAESPKRRRKDVNGLSDILGDAHDLAVYEATLARTVDDPRLAALTKLLIAVSAGRRAAIEKRALAVGGDLFYLSPSAFVSRLGI